MRPTAAPPTIDVAFPDLSRFADGNAGQPYVWRFASARPGPRLTIQALTHGNEVCGAIAVAALLDAGFRPVRGIVTFIFANVDAFHSFDPTDPYTSRCLDEDLNRVWMPDVLDGPRRSRELTRARALRACYDATDFLLDLHSMTDACPALALAGRQRKGWELARGVGLPQHIVIDAGHQAGKRLRDYTFFDDPADPRSALLIECGQHWERAAPLVALQATLRFLRYFDTAAPEFLAGRDRRRDDRQRRLHVRATRGGTGRRGNARHGARHRRSARDSDTVRRLRAGHAGAAAAQGGDGGPARALRRRANATVARHFHLGYGASYQ